MEIAEINQTYLENGLLEVEVLDLGVVWLDAGTHDSLLQASNFIQAAEERTGMMIGCPEEIAYQMGYIDAGDLKGLAIKLACNGYGEYLLRLLEDPSPRFLL